MMIKYCGDVSGRENSAEGEIHDCSLVLRRQGLMHLPLMVMDQLKSLSKLDLSHNSIENLCYSSTNNCSVSTD